MNQINSKRLLESCNRNISVINRIKPNWGMDAKVNFARVLENTKQSLRNRGVLNEDAYSGMTSKANNLRPSSITQLSDITVFPDHIINMVTALYASQVADELVSVQPLDQPVGTIVYLEYLYGNTRGDALAEEVMIDQWGAYKNGLKKTKYSSPQIVNELVTATTVAGVESPFTAPSCTISLMNLPLVFGVDKDNSIRSILLHDPSATNPDVLVYGDPSIVGSSTFQVYTEVNVTGDIVVDGKNYQAATGVTATVDVITGTVKISGAAYNTTMPALIADDGDTHKVNLATDYVQDLAIGPTKAGSVTLRLKHELLQAVPHKLRANYVFDAGYGLMKGYGINIEEQLISACTSEIRQERDQEVINTLIAKATVVPALNWSSTPSNYISSKEKAEGFAQALFKCASKIFTQTSRVFGNWAIVGKEGLDWLVTLGMPRFVQTDVAVPNGPYVAGILDGKMKIICSPFVPDDLFLVGYKGDTFTDAGFVLGDYLPITSTDFIMLDDFVGRKGFVSYYGMKMLNTDMYVQAKITA